MKGKGNTGPMKGQKAADATPSMVYAGGDSNVVKEAKAKKRGGSVKGKHVAAHGKMAAHRLDRPARKAGGRVGSDMKPFSSAANVKTPAGRDVDSEND
jgi:hypothetical protein